MMASLSYTIEHGPGTGGSSDSRLAEVDWAALTAAVSGGGCTPQPLAAAARARAKGTRRVRAIGFMDARAPSGNGPGLRRKLYSLQCKLSIAPNAPRATRNPAA